MSHARPEPTPTITTSQPPLWTEPLEWPDPPPPGQATPSQPTADPEQERNGPDEPAEAPDEDEPDDDEPAEQPGDDQPDDDEPAEQPDDDEPDEDEPDDSLAGEPDDEPDESLAGRPDGRCGPIVIPGFVLDEARARLEDSGVAGVEATGLLVAGPDRVARHVVFPDQRAGRNPCCWVQVTEQGKAELALALGPDDRYVARIHSHPDGAFHSATDDRNPALQYEGALSIVVPFYGLGLRAGLEACSVYVRRRHRWVELAPGPHRDEVIRGGA